MGKVKAVVFKDSRMLSVGVAGFRPDRNASSFPQPTSTIKYRQKCQFQEAEDPVATWHSQWLTLHPRSVANVLGGRPS